METTEKPKVEGSLRERATAALAKFWAGREAQTQRQSRMNWEANVAALVKAANGVDGLVLRIGQFGRLHVQGPDCPICEQETWAEAWNLVDLGDALSRIDKPFSHQGCKPGQKGLASPEQPKPYEASPAEVGLLKAMADFVDERVLFLREAGG